MPNMGSETNVYMCSISITLLTIIHTHLQSVTLSTSAVPRVNISVTIAGTLKLKQMKRSLLESRVYISLDKTEINRLDCLGSFFNSLIAEVVSPGIQLLFTFDKRQPPMA